MEKVKLTKEQSSALEKMRDCHHLRNDKEALLVKHARGWSQGYVVLNEITMIDFAQLILNDFSYEIEPEQPKFQPGDKVFVDWIDGGKVHQVAAVKNHGQVILQRDYALNCLPLMEVVRLATEEEIYWLETLGREKLQEFRKGDAVLDVDGSLTRLTTNLHISQAINWYRDRPEELAGIYPEESFKPFPKEPE